MDTALAPPPSMLERALAVARHAYAPYSHCRVGAAVRTASGMLHAGCNVENAVYGLGVCAERTAVATAVLAEAPDIPAIDEVVVVALDRDGRLRPAPPCGACRQVLSEFGADAVVWFVDRDRQWCRCTLRELLPAGFEL